MAVQSHDHDSGQLGEHAHHDMNVNTMALSATLHCLTGCAIGEIVGLMIGTALGLSNVATIAIAVALAFLFGYSLSTLPLLKAGLAVGAALSVVLAADTLSILTMEIVDNVVMAVIPGAMNAGLVNPIFWIGMMIALTAAFVAAYPVNRYLLNKGKGHALTHEYHDASGESSGVASVHSVVEHRGAHCGDHCLHARRAGGVDCRRPQWPRNPHRPCATADDELGDPHRSMTRRPGASAGA